MTRSAWDDLSGAFPGWQGWAAVILLLTAILILRERLQLNLDALEEHVDQALDAGNLDEAGRALQEMLRQNENSLAAHFHLARFYLRKGELKRALWHGRKTLRINPREPNAALNLGLIYEEMGNESRALIYYRRELTRDPYNGALLWNLGKFYFERKRWRAAAECLERCVQIRFCDDLKDTVYKLGQCYFKLNRVEDFIRMYERYLIAEPFAAWAAANLGGAYMQNKQYTKGILWLKRAFRLNPSGAIAEKMQLARKKLSNERLRKRDES